MASITCNNCGKTIEIDAVFCPFCGTKITANMDQRKETENENKVKDSTFANNAKEDMNQQGSASVAASLTKQPSVVVKKEIKIVIAILLLIAIVWAIGANTLFGKDKAAYDLVLSVAYQFNNPESIKLVSGSLSPDQSALFCGISATNGFGARSTSYYSILKGYIQTENSPASFYRDTKELNFKKINKKLTKTLGY